MTAEIVLDMEDKIALAQRAICANFGAHYEPCVRSAIVEVSGSLLEGQYPIHGWRRASAGASTGWFLWSGELTDGPADLFVPLEVGRLRDCAPITLPFLALGAGWRFTVTVDDVQVWEGDQAP